MSYQKPGAQAPSSTSRPSRSFGLDLSRARKKAGLALEQIAESTKISLRFLRAIEAEEFSQLPGGIFSTSYLRQYAAAIGFDEAELLAHFEHKMNPAPAQVPAKENGGRSKLDRWLRIPPAQVLH